MSKQQTQAAGFSAATVVRPDDLLTEFDALEKNEQRAWLGWFAGGKEYITKYGNVWRPFFGKHECEQVDFESVWLGKFVDLGWLTINEHRRFKAIGIEGQPEAIEYHLQATNKGWNVQEAYWGRCSS